MSAAELVNGPCPACGVRALEACGAEAVICRNCCGFTPVIRQEVDEADRAAFVAALREQEARGEVLCLPHVASHEVLELEGWLGEAADSIAQRMLGASVERTPGESYSSHGSRLHAAIAAQLYAERITEDYRRHLARFAMPLWGRGLPLTRYWRRRLEAERRLANRRRNAR